MHKCMNNECSDANGFADKIQAINVMPVLQLLAWLSCLTLYFYFV